MGVSNLKLEEAFHEIKIEVFKVLQTHLFVMLGWKICDTWLKKKKQHNVLNKQKQSQRDALQKARLKNVVKFQGKQLC